MPRDRRLPLLPFLLLAALPGAFAAPARAQDSPADDLSGRVPLSTHRIVDGELVVSIVGSPSLHRRDLSVDAESIVLWFDADGLKRSGGRFSELVPAKPGAEEKAPPPAEGSGAAKGAFAGEQPLGPLGGAKDLPASLKEYLGPVLHAVYAEGNVVFHLGTRTVRCDRFYIDFRRNLLLAGKVHMTVSVGDTSTRRILPLVLRAERMVRNAEGALALRDASFTSCDFGDPHYRFQSAEILISDEVDHVSFVSYHNVPKLGEVPLFYLPVLGGRSDLSARPLRSAAYRRSSRFGNEFSLLWGDDILLDGARWGEWRLYTEERTDRGPGIGPEVQYDYGDYEGELRTYWQKDNADTDDFDDSPVPRDERGRVRWEHRHRLGGDWRLDLSLFHFSDRNFQREYLKKEALEERDPETYAFLRYARGTDFASLSADVRLDDFRTETTRLPEGAFRRIGAEAPGGGDLWGLLDGATWSLDATAGAYERAYDVDLGVRGDRRLREDVVGRMEGVKRAGPILLAPFVVAGGTSWQGVEEPGEGSGRSRGDLAAGIRASVEARRDFPGLESAVFAFKGLHHVSMLEAQVYDRFAVTEDPILAAPVDDTDTLEEVRVVGLRWRNRLQARRAGRTVDWIDLELRGLFFPEGLDGAPPTLRFKEEGLAGPRNQDFLGEEKYRAAPPRGRWGPIEGDLRIWARENLFLLGEAEFDPDEHRARTVAGGVRWFVVPKVSLYAGNRRIAGDSNIVTLSATWAVSDRWFLHVAQQTDYRSDEGVKTEVGFRRVWHDFVLEVDLENDRLIDDYSLSFNLVPAFLWNPPTSEENLSKLDYEARRWYR